MTTSPPPSSSPLAVLRSAGLAALVALLLAGCSEPAALWVNGEAVPADELAREAARAGLATDHPALLARVVDERLQLQDARRRGLEPARRDVEEALERARRAAGGTAALRRELAARGTSLTDFRRELSQRLLLLRYAGAVTADVSVPEEAVRALFERERELLTLPERWGGTLVCHPDEADAGAARAALAAGEPLAEVLARAAPGSGPTELSSSETGPERRRLLELAKATPFGEPSEVAPLDGNACVLVPERYYLPRAPRYEDVEPTLRGRLEQLAVRRALQERLRELREAAEIRLPDGRRLTLPLQDGENGRRA